MSSLRGLVADTRPLTNPYFRRLWLANIVTVIGAQLTVVAVPAQLYALTGSSAYVGLTGVFGVVPLIVFGLWGGALADHFDRRALLRVTTIGLIATSAAFWAQAAVGLDNVWFLLCLFSVQQAFFAVNGPTRNAVLPRLLPPDQLPAANSLQMTVFQVGGIAGPLVGGALIPVMGFAPLYFLDTITLFATFWAVLRLPPLPVDRISDRTPGLRSVLDGLRYLRGHPVVLMSFVVDLIAMIFGMPRALFPELAHVNFHGPAEGGVAFALLFAGIPAGAVLGGVLSGWVSRVQRQGLAVIICIVVWGLSILGLGVAALLTDVSTSGMLAVAVVMLAIGGAADMASAAFRQSMLQSVAADELRGRLQGVFLVVVVGGPRIADVAHGSVAALAGAAVTTAGGGVLTVVGVVLAALLVPVFVRYRPGIERAGTTLGPT